MPKSIGISLLTAFQLALALIFQLAIAKLFGISKSADIYFASNTLNLLLVGVASTTLNFGLTTQKEISHHNQAIINLLINKLNMVSVCLSKRLDNFVVHDKCSFGDRVL